MADDSEEPLLDQENPDQDYAPPTRSQKMGLTFYGALALVGILVFLIVFLNLPGIRESAGILLVKNSWTLQSYVNSDDILIPAIAGLPVTARFDTEGTVSGSGGCNDYIANYTTGNLAITISPPSMTKRSCENQSVMQQESAYTSDLSKAAELRVSEFSLNLYDSAGKPVLVYRTTG